MTNRDENIDKVVEAVEAVEAEDVNGRGTVTLSTGVVLKIRPVPRHFLYEVSRRFILPKPPLVDMGKGRLEENSGDPDYAIALDKYLGDVATAGTDAALLFGTEVEFIPDGFPDSDSEEFVQSMEILGLERMDNPKARYLYWVKATAAPLTEDINGLLKELGRLTGVSENDTEDAVARFRSVTERGEDRQAIDE